MSDIQLNSQVINDLTRAAKDNGFDYELPSVSARWLRFGSSSPLMHGVSFVDLSHNDDGYLIAVYDDELRHVLLDRQLARPAFLPEIPASALDVVCVRDIKQLQESLQTVFAFVPDSPHPSQPQRGREFKESDLLNQFHADTCQLSDHTEAERMVKQRIGQNILRVALLKQETGQCMVTGLAIPELLVASHIKPWRDATDEERLCLDNVFLLAPHIDSLFDKGLITFDDDGQMLCSPLLSEESKQKLGLRKDMHILKPLTAGNRKFLKYHRENIYMTEGANRGVAGLAPHGG
jgi:hypothetical protein